MKNKILISLLLSLIVLTNVNAATETGSETNSNEQVATNPEWKIESLENEIESVEIISDKSIKINLKEYINFKDWYVNWDFTVLREWKTETSIKDENDSKIVNLKLKEDLETNSSYNLLAIEWTNASMDFITTENLTNQVIKNSAELKENGIDFITIVDKNNIKLHFKNELIINDFNFKLFEEINVSNKKWIFENDKSSIAATLEKSISSENAYMLTILELKTSTGNEITFTSAWYKDFGNIAKEEIITENNEILGEIAWNNNEETNDTALSTEQTPETGPTTNILLLLTFLLSWIYFVANRKKV